MNFLDQAVESAVRTSLTDLIDTDIGQERVGMLILVDEATTAEAHRLVPNIRVRPLTSGEEWRSARPEVLPPEGGGEWPFPIRAAFDLLVPTPAKVCL